MIGFPAIGSKVKFKGCSVIGECTGTVMKHYPAINHPIDDAEDAISMKPDKLPKPWPYGNINVFAPWLSDIEPIDK